MNKKSMSFLSLEEKNKPAKEGEPPSIAILKGVLKGIFQGILLGVFIFTAMITAYHYQYMNTYCNITIHSIQSTSFGSQNTLTTPYFKEYINLPLKDVDKTELKVHREIFGMVEKISFNKDNNSYYKANFICR